MRPLGSDEIRGNWATVLLPINEDESIDLVRLEGVLETFKNCGVDGLYTNGTAGEFHTQSEEEFDQIHNLVASFCNREGLPFQIGVSHMSAQISLDRLRRSLHYEPSAFQVILPDWVPPSPGEIVSFLKKMARFADPVGLVLYNPPHSKINLSPSEFETIKKEVPSLVGVKVAGGDEHWYHSMRNHMGNLSVFIPGHHLATGIKEGAQGAYSNVACLHPGFAQWWYEEILSDMGAALVVENKIQAFMNRHIVPFAQSGYSNPALDKCLAEVGAWTDIGTRLRWPYRFISEEEAFSLRSHLLTMIPELSPFIQAGLGETSSQAE